MKGRMSQPVLLKMRLPEQDCQNLLMRRLIFIRPENSWSPRFMNMICGQSGSRAVA